jgi:hypothetical protein
VPVQLIDRPSRAIGIAHLHEREAARLTRGAVANDRHGAHAAGALEQRLEVRLAGFVRQISNIQLRAHELLLHPEGWVNLMAGSSEILGDETQERRETRI